ncbi:anthrone oxygenase family protein [Streptomyces sp. NPDC001904]|uniref:anthrone oxygenase family protein n=1 Tax=Streptomyces sp. NPDC001904 TaxID=3154531 RepID=UPI003320B50F
MTSSQRFTSVLTAAAAVAVGLAAGTFYSFACAVMPALARSDDRTYVEVMRNINDVIQNPVFFASFLGAVPLTAVVAWRVRRDRGLRGWVWAAFVAYAAAFVLTCAVNVPLNDALARPGDPSRLRDAFAGPWVTWNSVRAALCTVSLGCLGWALARGSRRGWSRSSPRP